MKTKTIDELFEMVETLSTQDARYQFQLLKAESEWAREQLHIQEGDRFKIVKPINTNNGWMGYGEALAVGATGVVNRIYIHDGTWRAQIILDREWRISTVGYGGEVTRYRYGKAEDTPEGFKAPSGYDQKEHPEGRHHIFTVNLSWIEKIRAPESHVCHCEQP
jgi:hypothetical protein